VEFSNALLTPLDELSMGIRQAELTCRNSTRMDMSAVYVAGGAALLPGLTQFIEDRFHAPTRLLEALSSIATSGVTYSEHTDARFALAVSLALCLVGPDKNNAINLRVGELAKLGRSKEFNMTALKKPLASVGAIATCFFLSLIVQSMVYQSQLKDADAKLERSIRSFFGQLSSSGMRTYLANPSTLRAAVNKELGKERETAKLLGPNPKSPLLFLKDLSASVPKDIVVDMTEFQVGAAATSNYSPQPDAQASLTFLVKNPQMAEKLSGVIGSKLGAVQRAPMEEIQVEGGEKKWKVTFTGKPTEDSYDGK
jgi:hypothetical protein